MQPMNAPKLVPPEFMHHFNAATALESTGQTERANVHYQKAAEACPEAWGALANSMLKAGDKQGALRRYLEALNAAKRPESKAMLCNDIGAILERSGNRSEAENFFRLGLQHCPRRPDLLTNLGLCFQWRGEIDASIRLFNKALMIQPTLRQAEFAKSLSLLSAGEYVEGFKLYESRFSNPTSKTQRLKTDKPEWVGQPLEGKTILIYFEQGAGDTIQMMRYGPELKRMGAKTVLCCQKGIKPLAETQGCWNIIVEDSPEPHIENMPDFDFCLPTMSLPKRFHCVIPPSPYLPKPEAEKLDGFNIGIAWAGSCDHAHDAWRSSRISEWRPLFDLRGVNLHSLMIGHKNVDLVTCENNVLVHDCRTYLDTARLIAQMDLVIAVDTSVVHVAGALGVPCYVLTATAPDWRWGVSGEISPWYSSVRIVRQSEEFKWEEAIARVVAQISIRESSVAAQPSR